LLRKQRKTLGGYFILPHPVYPIAQGAFSWKPIILRSKSAKSAYSLSFAAPAFQKGLEYHNSDLNSKDSMAMI